MKFQIRIEGSPEILSCSDDQTVLRCSEVGFKRRIPVGCRQGGCGVCKVQVLEGTYRTRVMSRAHVSREDQELGRVLACCIWPASDLRIAVLGHAGKI